MALKTFWAAFKVKLQWLIDSADLIDRSEHANRLNVRLMTVNTEFSSLERSYQKILEIADTTISAEEEIVTSVRREYIRALEAFDKLMIVKLRDDRDSESSEPKPDIHKSDSDTLISRLPTLRLPTFSGEMDQWVGFNNLFDSLVDSRSDLSMSQKLAYLMSCLSGEARGLVQHIRISDEGYRTARDLLSKRYQNTRHLADVHVDQIMKLPIISQRLNGLRSQFLNPLIMAVNSLERLGFPVLQWSFLLLHIVLAKLPNTFKTRFEQKCAVEPDVIPTFAELIDFLETECRLLECANTDASGTMHMENVKYTSRPPRRGGQYTAAVAGQVCSYCGDTTHSLVKCPGFRSLSPFGRKDYTQQNRLCYYCLGNHSYRDCRNPPNCDGCGSRKHHPSLCFNRSGTVQRQNVDRGSSRRSPPRMGGGYSPQPGRPSGGSPRASPSRHQRRSPKPVDNRVNLDGRRFNSDGQRYTSDSRRVNGERFNNWDQQANGRGQDVRVEDRRNVGGRD